MVRLVESVCSGTEKICWHMMVTGSSAVLRAILLELCAELWPGLESNSSHALLVPQVMCTLGQPGHSRPGQPIGTVSVDPEPSHASRVGRNYLHLSSISNSNNAVEQANIKAQFEARAGFPNVIRAIDCTHSDIKAPSHDEFVYQQETYSFHQCTDRM